MHDEKEYKLGTYSQVSIASSYIHEVCSSNCSRYHLVDQVAWKCHVLSHRKPHLVMWKCHVSSRGNNIFHGKLAFYISRVATCVLACRNEV